MKVLNPVYGKHYAPGYCGFSRRNDGHLLSNGIVWVQTIDEACEFVASHVFLVINETLAVESAEKGVEFFELQKRIADPDLDIVFRKPLAIDDISISQIFAAASILEGTEEPYDYTGLLGAALRILLPLDKIFKPLRKLPVPLHVTGMYCSAFVSACYKNADRYRNIQLFRDYHITRISPVLLWNRFPFKPLRFEEDGI